MGSGILGLGETVLHSAAAFCFQQFHRSFGLAFLGHGNHVEGILGVGPQEAVVHTARVNEGAIGVLGQFLQALSHHLTCHFTGVLQHHVIKTTLSIAGRVVMLVHGKNHTGGLLLVLINDKDGLLVVGHGVVFNLSCIGGRGGDVLEHLLDFTFHVIHVHVTHDDQRLVVGTIPLVVIVAQHLIGEVVNDVHQADNHALAVLRAREDVLQLTGVHALLGVGGLAPLLMDDAALLVDVLVLEQQAVAPVLEDEQAGVEGTLARAGHVVDIIYGVGEARSGIQVTAEVQTQ